MPRPKTGFELEVGDVIDVLPGQRRTITRIWTTMEVAGYDDGFRYAEFDEGPGLAVAPHDRFTVQ